MPQALDLVSPGELTKARDELEPRVQDRTADLVQRTRNLEAQIARHRQADEQWKALLQENITQRKRAEAALRESQAHYRLLADNMADVLWTFDLQTKRCTYLSPSVQRLRGYTAEETIVQPVEQILTPESLALMKLLLGERIRAFLAGDPAATTQMNELDLMCKGGSTVHTETITTFVRNNDGGVSVVGVSRNINERKRAEEALRRQIALFEALMESNLDGILVVDSQGKKILQNRRLNELWKIPPHIFQDADDAKQVQFVTIRTKNPQQFAEKVAYLYAHRDEISHDETELIDGTVLDRYSSPVRDKNGTYYGRIWLFRDITEQRRLETQLRQAQKMEAIGQLAGGVAHDFNNILTATLMHIGQLQQNSQFTPATKESLKEVESATWRAVNLTRQLLLFSRRQKARIEPLDLDGLINDLLKMLRRLLGEDIEIAFQGYAGAIWVCADAGMLEQVVMNLCINARDAMPEGGQLTLATTLVEIKAQPPGAHPDSRPGNFVCLSVTDTGCGMDETVMARIFEPFFTTKEAGKGTGLGLATVYGIVKQHNGWVEVESKPGQGSSFRVYLPATTIRLGTPAVSSDVEEVKGGSETILLVEDELFLRQLTALCLRKLGYAVLEAGNGWEALRLWEQHHQEIALLFTDMRLPGNMTGLDLAMRLKKEKGSLKVIGSSGYNVDLTESAQAAEQEITRLPKPYAPTALAKAVRRCLHKPQGTP